MAILHNRVSQKELKERLYQETETRITLSFYHYFSIEDTQRFRNDLYRQLSALHVFGRIYVASEGINAQVSVPKGKFGELEVCLRSIQPLQELRLNMSVDDDGKSFWVLKVKVRGKIVADGIEDSHFDMRHKGKYVNAVEFNQLAEDPATIVVDMRNHYEFEVGHFQNAIEIPSDTFREQLPMAVDMLKENKDKNIIMYCTGGIRCEKASAYMLHHGFTHVYHLEGGIIHYANTVKANGLPNKFIGKNFVFDDRLGERITGQVIARCHQCGEPADSHTNCNNDGCHLLFIQCKACAEHYNGCCSEVCKNVYSLPLEEQIKLREGSRNGVMIFNKSRQRLRPRLSESTRDMKGPDAG
ncbi:MAG: rhodanese-related sulfurtransferase [Chitinophagaceae bacterium]